MVNILSILELDLVDSLARRGFIRILKPYVDDINAEISGLRKKYAEKAPDGSMKKQGDQIEFNPENRKLLNKDWDKLMDLNIEIDWSGEEKDKETCRGLIQKEIDNFKKLKNGKFNDNDFAILTDMEETCGALK